MLKRSLILLRKKFNMQKGQALIFLLVGILVFVVVGGIFYLGRLTSPKPSPGPVVISRTPQPVSTVQPNQVCLAELKKSTGEFVKGEILIGFKSELSADQIRSILDKYGLTSKQQLDFPSTKILLVVVPTGEEFEWICRLKVDSAIESVNVNGVNRIL